jgi:hypothetical protein
MVNTVKWLGLFAAVLGLINVAALTWWHVSDGMRFNRAMQDLSTLTPDELGKQAVTDPWGGSYLVVASTSGAENYNYVFSRGPDGRSNTLGNDADDIIPWKDSSLWLASLHPISWMKSLLGLSLMTLVGSISFLIGSRCRSTTIETKS